MARLPKNLIPCTVFLVLGAAVLSSWSCALPPETMGGHKALGTWWVDVPRDDTAVPDNIHLSKKKGQRVVWHTDRAGKLSITWEKGNPFPNLTCEGSVCLSGKIADEAYGPYVYHIAITTAEKVASIDPIIMIDP
jgi:hypothetical protein